MAHTLCVDDQDKIRNLFLTGSSIKAVSRALGFSKNTIKKLIRAEGLATRMSPIAPALAPVATAPEFNPIDFSLLEKLFEMGREPGENLDFQKHVKAIAVSMSAELGVKGTIDKIRLETAIFQYIAYRRFYFKSLTCSDKSYLGPLSKAHEKLAKAVHGWVDASNKALDQFSRLTRELEVKYGKRVPDLGRGNVFVQNQQVNVAETTAIPKR